MIYFCAQSQRRELVLQAAGLNGIDYLEVLGDPGCGDELAVTFLKDARTLNLTSANVSITGGAPVAVIGIAAATAEDPTTVTVELSDTGDFSTYTFSLVAGPDISDPPAGLDPQLSSLTFSFKAGCPTPADCLPLTCCPARSSAPPDINYLAKDFGGFVQVMLDRLAVITPTWTETHPADIGIAIVEALAYAADHLSYQQDAVSTESYIDTARSRISLRRHARLVDYTINEGCNARTFVYLATAADGVPIPAGTQFYAGAPGLAPAAQANDAVAAQLKQSTQPVFESLQDGVLYVAHNKIDFYTWGNSSCCLPQGATEATLDGSYPDLAAGDVLIFEEVLGPQTGDPADADPTHRCAVSLNTVTLTNHTGAPLQDPVNGEPITQIGWAPADALAFPLCISSTMQSDTRPVTVEGVSVARGNVVPADHGVWIDPSGEDLGTVPPAPAAPVVGSGCSCTATSPVANPGPRFYPSLQRSPLTFSVPYNGTTSAAAFLDPDSAAAAPNLTLTDDNGNLWTPRTDLLSAGGTDRVFVPEIENDGTVFLRFGDGQYGMAADPGLSYAARYRVGNGSAGDLGRDALAHAVLPAGWSYATTDIALVRNPLPGTGGIDPEDMQHIAQFAPFAYESQRRCVTEADYGQSASSVPGVSEARATLRWTGSWYTAFVSAEPTAPTVTPALIDSTTTALNMLRMMGTDVAVEAAVIVGLKIVIEICVGPEHFRGDVYAALMQVFISGNQCDGTKGLLNASNFVFGQTVYASPLIAAAQAVEGVLSASLVTFTRMDAPSVDGVTQGYLTMGRLDIPRCDNDPDHLDHGTFTLQMDGGK